MVANPTFSHSGTRRAAWLCWLLSTTAVVLYAVNITAFGVEAGGFAIFLFSTQAIVATLMACADIRRSLLKPQRYIAALAAALIVCGIAGSWIVLSPAIGRAVGGWVFALAGIPYLLAPLVGLASYYVAAVLVARPKGS